MTDGEAGRARMADLVARKGVRDPRVLAALREVPREAFVPEALRAAAFEDGPLPIGEGQTISQPFVVALMAEAARLSPADRVREVGAGSGYAAAVLGRLAGEVHAVERLPALAASARARLAVVGAGNVRVHEGDGTLGWPAAAPFDAILVSAGGPVAPAALKAQLAPGGRLVIPVGAERGLQRLLRLTREGEGLREEDLGGVRFVPLVGAQGWADA